MRTRDLGTEPVREMMRSFEQTSLAVRQWIAVQEKAIADGGTPYERHLAKQQEKRNENPN